MHLSRLRTDTQVQRKTEPKTYTWENRAPVHLSRLWTDAPVKRRTQVNKTSKTNRTCRNQSEVPTGAKGPTQLIRGAKRETKMKRRRSGATQEQVFFSVQRRMAFTRSFNATQEWRSGMIVSEQTNTTTLNTLRGVRHTLFV